MLLISYFRKKYFMVQAIQNNILVEIGDVFLRRVSDIMKVSMAESRGSTLNPADLVQIIGKVVSVPRVCKDRLGSVGYSADGVRPGDTIIFRYDVVYSFDEKRNKWKNMFWYKGREYWSVDVIKAFAYIRNEKIFMINGYCMIEDISDSSAIILPEHMRNISQTGTATLTQIGTPLRGRKVINAHPGDTVFFNPRMVQKYEIGGKPFGIIRQQDVLGTKISAYSNLLM